MPANILNGIEYVHATNTFTKGIDAQGPYYDVEYLIASWSDSDSFANALIGIGQASPHRHPLSTNLLCVEAAVVGHGGITTGSAGNPDYAAGARIRARYRSAAVLMGGGFVDLSYDDPTLDHQIDPSTPLVWCTQELDYEIETITVGNSSYLFLSDSMPITEPVQVDIPITLLTLTFHRLSYLPATAIRSLRGHVNRSTFLGAPAGTVLFRGGKTARDWNTDGTTTQRVSLLFAERPIDWNKFLRPDALPYDADGTLNETAWDFVVDSLGNLRYPEGDLSDLVIL